MLVQVPLIVQLFLKKPQMLKQALGNLYLVNNVARRIMAVWALVEAFRPWLYVPLGSRYKPSATKW